MRLWFLRLACLCLALPALAASSFEEAARQLDGSWADESGYVLKIDSRRAQASTDPAKPFQWQRFIVREVDGSHVVFAVGPEIFEATLDENTVVVTSTSFRGERTLTRLAESEAQP